MLSFRLTRRMFVSSAAAAAAATLSPLSRLQAQSPGRFVRHDAFSPAGKEMLKAYAKAVDTMLGLDPRHEHNWYRNALRHTLDCPHGNWWFLPWHRGYTGWFEKIVRIYSGRADFAFPYWDWTKHPQLPPEFRDPNSILNPAHPKYIQDFATFRSRFKPVMDEFYRRMTPAQRAAVSSASRDLATSDRLFQKIQGDPKEGLDPFFPAPGESRRHYDDPHSLQPTAAFAVSTPLIECAREVTNFYDFGSYPANEHADMAKFGIFEGFPHNAVHNDFEGFMQDMLSPVDPMFALHHSNIDREWDIWARMHDNPLPTDDRARWEAEVFPFFIDDKGKPVTLQTCGDYIHGDLFHYTYDSMTPPKMLAHTMHHANAAAVQAVNGAQVSDPRGDRFEVSLPMPLLKNSGVGANAAAQKFVLEVTVSGMPRRHGEALDLYADPAAGELSRSSESYLGTLQFFGVHAHSHGPVTFVVPFCQRLKNCLQAKADLAAARKTGDPAKIAAAQAEVNATCTDQPKLQLLAVAPKSRGPLLRATASEFHAVGVKLRPM